LRGGAAGGARADWADSVYSYVQNKAVYSCPSSPAVVPNTAYGNDGGYALNWVYFCNFTSPQPIDGVADPANTIWLTDGTGYYCCGGLNGPASAWYGYLNPCHNSMLNVLFVDGHVKDELIPSAYGVASANGVTPGSFGDDSRNSNLTSATSPGHNGSPANPNVTSVWDMD
jgi:prepilin-type processing-associated H-X9-DG protein